MNSNSDTSLLARQIRLQQWAEQIHLCQNRPGTMYVEEWCKQNGITKADYYYRLRQVRKACLITASGMDNQETAFAELPILPETDTSASAAAPFAEIHVGRLRIDISDSASELFIRKLLGAIGHAE